MGIVALLLLGFVVGFVVGIRFPRFWLRERPVVTASSARLEANEIVAIAMLRNLVSGQAQLQQSGKSDTDRDGPRSHGHSPVSACPLEPHG